jgi:hypothetical protein
LREILVQLNTQAEITLLRQTLKNQHQKSYHPDHSSLFRQHFQLAHHHRPTNQANHSKNLPDENRNGPTSLINPPFSATTVNIANGATIPPKPKRKQKEREN